MESERANVINTFMARFRRTGAAVLSFSSVMTYFLRLMSMKSSCILDKAPFFVCVSRFGLFLRFSSLFFFRINQNRFLILINKIINISCYYYFSFSFFFVWVCSVFSASKAFSSHNFCVLWLLLCFYLCFFVLFCLWYMCFIHYIPVELKSEVN